MEAAPDIDPPEMTPEEAVTDAIANAELAGGVIPPGWAAVLLAQAHGRITANDAVQLAIWCEKNGPRGA